MVIKFYYAGMWVRVSESSEYFNLISSECGCIYGIKTRNAVSKYIFPPSHCFRAEALCDVIIYGDQKTDDSRRVRILISPASRTVILFGLLNEMGNKKHETTVGVEQINDGMYLARGVAALHRSPSQIFANRIGSRGRAAHPDIAGLSPPRFLSSGLSTVRFSTSYICRLRCAVPMFVYPIRSLFNFPVTRFLSPPNYEIPTAPGHSDIRRPCSKPAAELTLKSPVLVWSSSAAIRNREFWTGPGVPAIDRSIDCVILGSAREVAADNIIKLRAGKADRGIHRLRVKETD